MPVDGDSLAFLIIDTADLLRPSRVTGSAGNQAGENDVLTPLPRERSGQVGGRASCRPTEDEVASIGIARYRTQAAVAPQIHPARPLSRAVGHACAENVVVALEYAFNIHRAHGPFTL